MSKSAGLVIGGNFSTRSQFPWIAVIAVRNNKHWVHQGSGSLITSRHVVVYVGTVSYPDASGMWISVSAARTMVFMGVTKSEDLKQKGVVKASVERIVSHPDAKMVLKSLTVNKVAVIRLRHEVSFSEFIRPVCLRLLHDDLAGKDALAVGYGRDENGMKTLTKKHVHVTVTDDKKCEESFTHEFQVANETKLFCTLGNGKSGPCIYDDQLYNKIDSHWYLKGILTTSFLFEDGSCVVDKPSLYEDITPLVPWILKQIYDSGIEVKAINKPTK
jgi:hypothetical protein